MEPKCNLIIDSCCDLPYDLVNIDGVDVIEYLYVTDEGEQHDDMYQTITPHDFYEAMRNGAQPTTIQVPAMTYREHFERAIKSGVPTVFLSFTSGLSGSFDTAMIVYNQLMEEYPDAELYMVDLLLASVGQALPVHQAIIEREKGKTAKELADWAKEAIWYVDASFFVDDLEALHRGGRIPAGVAFAGSKLDVKPYLNFTKDGKLGMAGVVRGSKKRIKFLADHFAKCRGYDAPGQYVVVGHADCPDDLKRLEELILEVDDTVQFIECNIGPTIGSHVGPGMLALVFWGHDRRK